MNILGIETTSFRASVAVLNNETYHIEYNEVRDSTSDKIVEMVDSVLSKTNIELKNLDYIVVNVGPGSFIGTRIGISYVAGIKFGLDIPVIGVNSFEILVSPENNSDNFFSIVYAGRERFFLMEVKNNEKKIHDNTSYTAEEIYDLVNRSNSEVVFLEEEHVNKFIFKNITVCKSIINAENTILTGLKNRSIINGIIEPIYCKQPTIG